MKNDIENISKEIITGEERELSGFLEGSESSLGRSGVIDLNKPEGDDFKTVDHRTLLALVMNNTKYIIK